MRFWIRHSHSFLSGKNPRRSLVATTIRSGRRRLTILSKSDSVPRIGNPRPSCVLSLRSATTPTGSYLECRPSFSISSAASGDTPTISTRTQESLRTLRALKGARPSGQRRGVECYAPTPVRIRLRVMKVFPFNVSSTLPLCSQTTRPPNSSLNLLMPRRSWSSFPSYQPPKS